MKPIYKGLDGMIMHDLPLSAVPVGMCTNKGCAGCVLLKLCDLMMSVMEPVLVWSPYWYGACTGTEPVLVWRTCMYCIAGMHYLLKMLPGIVNINYKNKIGFRHNFCSADFEFDAIANKKPLQN